MATSQTVPMIAPDGSIGEIPMERMQDAVHAGFQVGVNVVSPDGKTGVIPAHRYQDALKSGFKIDNSKNEQPNQQPNQPAPKGAATRAVQAFNSSFGVPESVQDHPSEAVQGVKSAVMHPSTLIDSVSEMAKGFLPAQNAAYDQGKREFGEGSHVAGVVHMVESGIPFVGPALVNADNRIASKDYAGAGGALVGTGLQVGAPVAAHAPMPGSLAAAEQAAGVVHPAAPTSLPLQGALAGRMAEVPPGEQFSRGEVLSAARDNGVNLDLAQATDSGLAHAVKKANRYSLASQTTYEGAQTKNLNALEQWADSEASKYSPASSDRAAVGGQMQSLLQRDLAEKKSEATDAFQGLDKSVGKSSVDVTSNVQQAAAKIISENKPYYDAHPELVPKQAWSIVNDLAKMPEGATSKSMPWGELHRLRSDLMDVYRNNTDIVQTQGNAWLQQMVKTIDDAMTSKAAGLSPKDLRKFRAANEQWQSIKSTFDNPQHPFYQAVRSQFPSQVPGMLSRGTPELAAQVRQTLGDLQGPFQRQFVENLLNGKDGTTLDLKNLNSRLSRIPQDHLASMLGDDGARSLRMLGKVAAKVTADSNPSGTAKVGVPASEAAALFTHPVVTPLELAAQFLTAKTLNSPKAVDFLTKP